MKPSNLFSKENKSKILEILGIVGVILLPVFLFLVLRSMASGHTMIVETVRFHCDYSEPEQCMRDISRKSTGNVSIVAYMSDSATPGNTALIRAYGDLAYVFAFLNKTINLYVSSPSTCILIQNLASEHSEAVNKTVEECEPAYSSENPAVFLNPPGAFKASEVSITSGKLVIMPASESDLLLATAVFREVSAPGSLQVLGQVFANQSIFNETLA